jgi:hypothetical protein
MLHKVLVRTTGHVGHFRHNFVSFFYMTHKVQPSFKKSGRQAICTPNKEKCYIVGCVKIIEEITAMVTEHYIHCQCEYTDVFFCHCISVHSVTSSLWTDWEERSFRFSNNPDWHSKDSTKRKENSQHTSVLIYKISQ